MSSVPLGKPMPDTLAVATAWTQYKSQEKKVQANKQTNKWSEGDNQTQHSRQRQTIANKNSLASQVQIESQSQCKQGEAIYPWCNGVLWCPFSDKLMFRPFTVHDKSTRAKLVGDMYQGSTLAFHCLIERQHTQHKHITPLPLAAGEKAKHKQAMARKQQTPTKPHNNLNSATSNHR